MTRIAIASDHGGFELKRSLSSALTRWGHEVQDLGANNDEPTDYPDYAHLMGDRIGRGDFEIGVLLCGTGIGMSIAANKHPGVRAAVVSDTFSAQMARQHNHANVLCMGGRVVGPGLAEMIVKAFVDAKPDHSERHERRVAKIEKLDA